MSADDQALQPGLPQANLGILSKDKQKIDNIVRASHEILAEAHSVFPFTLFPDTITVDRTKITLTIRSFFRSAEVFSIRIEDVLNVTTTVGPFLGTVSVMSRVFNTDKPHTVTYLKRADAIHLKHVAQGYVIALHNNIDCSQFSKEQLIKMLEKLGHDTQSDI